MNNLNKFQILKNFTSVIKISTMMVLFFMLLPNIVISQDKDKNQAYWIHEDKVKPSMTKDYEKVSKDFIAQCKKHDLKDVNWITAATNEGSYMTISEINNMADLDKNTFKPLQEKMGKEDFGKLFERFDKCYDSHGSYIIELNKKLSFMPNSISQTQEGMDYRRWHFLYFTPSNKSKVKENLVKLKELYAKKGSKVHYRVYQNGFGSSEDYYLIVVSAKDGLSYEKSNAEARTLFGDSSKPVFDELFKYVSKYEMKTGSMKPELSFSSK